MIVALFETSTERSIIALFKEGKLLGSSELPCGLTSSKYLLSEFHKLLEENKLHSSDLRLILSGMGPGSYTGIRVGASIAKTLSFACEIPLVGVCSLEGFWPNEEGSFAAVIDAKIGGVYIRFGEKRDGRVIWENEAEVAPLEKVAEKLSEVERAITPNSEALKQKLTASSWTDRYPDPLAIYSAGMKKFHAGEFAQDSSMELKYLRKTQAELMNL